MCLWLADISLQPVAANEADSTFYFLLLAFHADLFHNLRPNEDLSVPRTD